MKRLILFAFIFAVAMTAAGCVMPKDFTAKMNVAKDGSYDFTYDGSVYYLPILEEKEKGTLNPMTEETLSEEFLAKIGKDENASNVAYIGDGAFKVSYRKSGNINEEPLKLPSGWGKTPLFTFKKTPDVTHVVFQFLDFMKSEKESAKIPGQAKDVKGVIEFTTELPVESTTGNPEHKEGSTLYVWKISGIDRNNMPSITMNWVEPPPQLPIGGTPNEAMMQ